MTRRAATPSKMTITLLSIITAVAVAEAAVIRRTRRKLERMQKALGEALSFETDFAASAQSKAYVEHRNDPVPHFAVFRKGISRRIDILRVAYAPSDPDDREYKLIWAQERADMLNEKP